MMDCTDRHDRYFLRLISKNVMLYSEMVATKSAIHGDRKRILGFREEEKPVALQVGGSDKNELAEVAKLAEQFGYDEININLGCPSKKVQKNSFGACLMKEPDLVAECINNMVNSCKIPVTAKTRIGVDEIEDLCRERLKTLFDATWVNVQPHSGSQANTAVFDAFLKPGDKILGLDLSHGGHLTHGSNVNFSGKIYQSSFYGVTKDGVFDYNEILRKAKEVTPNLIIVGASAYSRDIDFSKFREIADEVGAFLHADIAHPSGLIAKGFLSDPVPYCHVITSTTHKTLRGPRGGIIISKSNKISPCLTLTPSLT